MVTPLTPRTAPAVAQGDLNLSRLASLQTNGARPSTLTVRTGKSSNAGINPATSGQLAQNVVVGGSAFGGGNMSITSGPRGRVATTAAHVLIHPNIGAATAIPTRIHVNGSEARTSIKEFFPQLKEVKIFVITDGVQGIDVVKIGPLAAVLAHLQQLAVEQPTARVMKTAFEARQATWQISTASQPQSYAPGAPSVEPLAKQANWSETAPKFSFGLTALPLQVKDLSADLKASGMGSLAGKPESWLALGAIGGDENNRQSPYKDLFLVNRGVSGSESAPGIPGVPPAGNGTLIGGADQRDGYWTLDNVENLVGRNAALRSALKTKFPDLTTPQAAEKLYKQGFVKIAFITKEIAISNLKTIDRTTR